MLFVAHLKLEGTFCCKSACRGQKHTCTGGICVHKWVTLFHNHSMEYSYLAAAYPLLQYRFTNRNNNTEYTGENKGVRQWRHTSHVVIFIFIIKLIISVCIVNKYCTFDQRISIFTSILQIKIFRKVITQISHLEKHISYILNDMCSSELGTSFSPARKKPLSIGPPTSQIYAGPLRPGRCCSITWKLKTWKLPFLITKGVF